MAIHPIAPPPAPAALPTGGVSLDIQAWTEEASQAMSLLDVNDVHDGTAPVEHSSPAPAVRAVTLDIPLDERTPSGPEGRGTAAVHTVYKRSTPVRRDSMDRREALLKGKEGSRQRRRWENDRLLGNPYLQPPLPSDWEVRPTYPVHTVPYYLAPLWDSGLAAQKDKAQRRANKHAQQKSEAFGKGRVPKEFKEKMRKNKGAKGMLQDLELEVRSFVVQWQEKEKAMAAEGLLEADSEDDEMVFVGRNGTMHDRFAVGGSEDAILHRELMLFDSLADDGGAAFCRWLIHHIGSYYGLSTWSVTVGRPPRREAYVGLNSASGRPSLSDMTLPRPLYGLV